MKSQINCVIQWDYNAQKNYLKPREPKTSSLRKQLPQSQSGKDTIDTLYLGFFFFGCHFPPIKEGLFNAISALAGFANQRNVNLLWE